MRNWLYRPCRIWLFHQRYRIVTTSFHLDCKKFAKKDDSISQIITPVLIKPGHDDINVGAELTGTLDKADLLKILNKFTQRKEIRSSCLENGLDSKYTM